jgi:hypothetical protein
MQWTGAHAARLLSAFMASSFSRFDEESRPTHLPLRRAVWQLFVFFAVVEIIALLVIVWSAWKWPQPKE